MKQMFKCCSFDVAILKVNEENKNAQIYEDLSLGFTCYG